MSELATSIGSIGVSVATAAPAVGPSFGAEMGAIGASSFSGLGRMDTGLGSFSVNEGPRGPVSFTNSIDLFSETRAFTPSLVSIPEGKVSGNIFGEDMITIAKSDTLEPKSATFGDFEPASTILPIEEGPVKDFRFGDTQPIARPEALNDTASIIEKAEIEDPLVAEQLASDLAIVDHIIELTESVRSDATAVRISNIAIQTALDRANLFEEVLPEPEPGPEPEAQSEITPPQAITPVEVKNEYKEPGEEPVQPESRVEFYVDEEANNARRTNTERAIVDAFKDSADPETGKVDGSKVIAKLSPEPPDEEISELVLYTGGKVDGSETERRKDLAGMTFESEEAGREANERAIAKNNAVTYKRASKRATDAEVAKVKSKTEFKVLETQIFPLAA
jgi:hypothetical protein